MTPADPWAPYAPDAKQPWDLRRVVHLHRRAAFAGTWPELQRDLADGPEKAVARLLAGGPPAADFDATAALLADAAVAGNDIARLKAAWFYRLLFTPDPMLEKLTLVWHGHFATAHAKVGDVGLMRRQNDTLRAHAKGKFAALLNAAVRDPALLVYLDAPANRAGRPNENLGRELLELFTLGVGRYTEADVKAAARALAGWTVDDGAFADLPGKRDRGPKTVLGVTADLDGTKLVDLLLKQPAAAERVAGRLVGQLFGEASVPAVAAKQLAAVLRERGLDISWVVGTVLRSELFFADANVRSRVLSPVEFVAGAARALELFDPAPSALALADWAGRMGQDVFDPPNVAGWPGGRDWLHARGLVARANCAAALVTGPASGRDRAYDAAGQAKRHGFAADPAGVLQYHHRLLFGTDPPAEVRARLGPLDPSAVATAILSSPDAQLG